MPQAQTFSSRQSEPTAQMTGEEKVWVAEGSLGLVRAVRATYFFARITAFFTGDAVGCQKTVMLFSLRAPSNVHRPVPLADSVPIPSVARPATSAWCGDVRAVRPPRRSPVLPNFNSRVALVCLHNSRKAAKKRPTSRQGSGSPRWVVVGLD